MAAKWDPRITLGIVNTQAAGLTCVATINSGGRRCQNRLNSDDKDQILSRIDNMPEIAPTKPATEAATLRKIALGSFCRHHNDEVHVANAVREWQRALTAARAALAIITRLQSEGIEDVDDPEDDNNDSDISSTGGSDSEGESDDGHLPDGDDTTSTTISIGSDSNPEPNESPETENLREELARVTPELDELRQQLARATPEAEVEDLREQLERATLEREQVKLESEQIKRESAQFMRNNKKFRLENKRLRRMLDEVKRISTGLDAEPEVEERQS